MKNKLKLSESAKATLMFTLANVIHYGCSFLYTPVFARLMTQEEYGKVTMYTSWVSLLTPLLTLNIWSCAYIGFLEYKEQKDSFTSNVLRTTLPLAGLIILITATIPQKVSALLDLPTPIVWFLLATIFTTPAFQIWSARQRFEYRYKALFAVSCISSVAVLVFGIAGVFLLPTQKAYGRILGGGAFQLIIYAVLFVLLLRRGSAKANRTQQKFALKMALAQLPNGIAVSLLNQTDRIMIARLLDESALAIYGMAGTISNAVYSVILAAINASWSPFILKAMDEKRFNELRRTANYLICLVALGCFSVILVAPEGLLILGGKAYIPAKWCVPGLLLGLLLSFVEGCFLNVILYCKRPQYVCIGTVTAACINMCLNAICIPVFGVAAASYTSMLGSVVICVMDYIIMRHILKARGQDWHIFDLRGIALICFGTIVASVFCAAVLYEAMLIRYFIVAMIAVVLWMKREKLLKLVQANR